MRLALFALLTLTGCSNGGFDGKKAVAEDEARYARDHPAGRFHMVQAGESGGVYVLDTQTGQVALCNTEIVRYRTWCSLPAAAMNGTGLHIFAGQ